MSLNPGTKLGPYEIQAPLGAGAMGEVYKAKDTRLDRTVAIKVLPAHLSDNARLKERFEREARAVSSLNHPHICTLYDIGSENGVDFMVMEHIEGDTLADRLKKGALPLDQALRYGIEIADALDKAHRQGVVHRDLKPGNIMLTKSGAKLLDFGLAKMTAEQTNAAGLSALPTEAKPLTQEGSILGTFQYMAPEQLEGKEVDARTDIFAFGAVLYEMMTGKKAFEGESHASLIAAILDRDPPPVSAGQAMTPPALDRVVERCLAKDPEDRWQTARDLDQELEWVRSGGSEAASLSTEAPGWRRAIPYVATALAVGVAIGLAAWSLFRPEPRRVARFVIPPAPNERLYGWSDPNIAISPDGSRIVYVAERDGLPQLILRPIDRLEAATLLADTEIVHSPFFSPDGQWVGFFSHKDGRMLKKMSIAGGPSVKICDVQASHLGASWGEDDTIVFSSVGGGLARVSASGGTPEVLTTPDLDRGEIRHEFPEILPGGGGVLYTIRSGTGPDDTQIAVLPAGEGKPKIVATGGTGASFAPTGHLLYGRLGKLMAMPFDLNRLEGKGPPVPIVENILTTADGPVVFSFSRDGSLVYAPGIGIPEIEHMLVWVERDGNSFPIAEGLPSNYANVRLSPDGGRLAIQTGTPGQLLGDIWIYDLERETRNRLTFEGSNVDPVWTPDGDRITFMSNRGGDWNLYWKRADGGGEAELLKRTEDVPSPHSWSPDGNVLAYHTAKGDIWMLPLEGDRTPLPFLVSPFHERSPSFSPDGQWVAYVSDESGRDEVYVRPYPGPGAKVVISTDGGRGPAWSARGGEMFYRNNDQMIALPVATQPTLKVGTPKVLFEQPFASQRNHTTYDVSPDGDRFIMLYGDDEATMRELHVVLNWFEELKRIVPE